MTEETTIRSIVAELGDRLRDAGSEIDFNDVLSAFEPHFDGAGDVLVAEAVRHLAPAELALARAAATRIDALRQAVQALPAAAIALSEAGMMLAANEAGKALLAPDGDMPALDITRDELSAFVSRCRARPDRPRLLVPHGAGRPVLAARWRAEHAAGIVTVVRWDWPDGLLDELIAVFGLTRRECEVLGALMDGATPETVAARNGRSPGTVRQQIKAVLAKLGVSNQAQAVAMAAGLAMSWRRLQQVDPALPANAFGMSFDVVRNGRRDVGVRRFGFAGGAPAVLIHGALFGAAELEAERAAAHAAGLSVLAVEKPGYGRTPPAVAGADAVEPIVNDVLAAMDAHGMNRAVVIAHDAGTAAAFRLAERAAGRVAGVLAAPATPPMLGWEQTSDMPRSHRIHAWVAQRAPKLLDLFITLGIAHVNRQGAAILPDLFFGGCDFDRMAWARPEFRSCHDGVYRFIASQGGKGFRQDMVLTNLDWSARARAVGIPVILMHGAMSQTVSRKAVEQFADSLPDAGLIVVPDAGHTLPLTHPDLVFSTAAQLWRRSGRS